MNSSRPFAHLSLALSCTHTHTHTRQTEVILKGHPAFPTFSLVPGILASVNEDLPDPLLSTHKITHNHTWAATKTWADVAFKVTAHQSDVTRSLLIQATQMFCSQLNLTTLTNTALPSYLVRLNYKVSSVWICSKGMFVIGTCWSTNQLYGNIISPPVFVSERRPLFTDANTLEKFKMPALV